MPSPRRVARFARTRAARTVATSAGSPRRSSPSANRRRRTTSPRIASGARAADDTHTTEVVVGCGPASHGPTARLERGKRGFVDAGLGVDELSCGMEARALNRNARRKSFVEDAGDHAEQCGPQARPTGRARGEANPVAVEHERRGHHAEHARAGLERTAKEVRLAEHAIEVEVQAREEVARPEPETRCDDARIAFVVDDSDVRRVTSGV